MLMASPLRKGEPIEIIQKFIKKHNLKTRLPKFALVGASGFLVNQGVLFLAKAIIGIPVAYAGIIAIETAIISNFLLNNFWTWKDSRENSFWSRLAKYHSVTIVSGGVNYGILLLLTHLGMYYLIANMIGIGCGMIINFFFNHFWTFKKSE
mgnify:FL=1